MLHIIHLAVNLSEGLSIPLKNVISWASPLRIFEVTEAHPPCESEDRCSSFPSVSPKHSDNSSAASFWGPEQKAVSRKH